MYLFTLFSLPVQMQHGENDPSNTCCNGAKSPLSPVACSQMDGLPSVTPPWGHASGNRHHHYCTNCATNSA